MKNNIDSFRVQRIMDEWSKEADKDYNLFYKIIEKDIFIYSDRPGVWIGGGGERINRYEAKLQEVGVSKVNIVEVKNARIPEYTYGMEVCPLESGGSCYDFDRLGTIACGICGANAGLAKDGMECFARGMNSMMQN